MKQRNNAHNSKNCLWQRTLPVQSLCWLSSFSLLSSGLVFAQTESAVDNIVPAVENSSPTSADKVKTDTSEVHQSASASESESAQEQTEYARRRAKLTQRLRRTEIAQPVEQVRRYRVEISQTAQPRRHFQSKEDSQAQLVRKLRHHQEDSVADTGLRRLRAALKSTTRTPVVIREENQTQTPQRVTTREENQTESATTATSTSKPKDYNNAYIDTTEYNIGVSQKYQAPSVVITERSNSCQSILAQGMSRAFCGTPQTNQLDADSDTNQTAKPVPSWLRRSQNPEIAESPTSNTSTGETNNFVRHLVRKAVDEKSNTPIHRRPKIATDDQSNTPIDHHLIAKDEENTSIRRPIRAEDEENTPIRRPIRIDKSGDDSPLRRNRFINNDFTPTTTVSSTPIAPQGGALPAPMTADNLAPRPSTVTYDIPLASTLPQISFSGGMAYGGKGLMFPLSMPSPITSLFGWRNHPITGDRSFHSGTDLGAAMGTPVLAAYSGQVEIADSVGGYGLTVVLNHKNAQQTLYGHMSQLLVQPGQYVQRGTVLGLVGSTGISTGPHLHFEVRQLTPEGWVAIDPSTQIESALDQLVQALHTAQGTTQPGS